MKASNQQSRRGRVPLVFTPHNVRFDAHAKHLRELAAHVEFDEAELVLDNPQLHNREQTSREIEALQLSCPINSMTRRIVNNVII
jgi:hypothetical protein